MKYTDTFLVGERMNKQSIVNNMFVYDEVTEVVNIKELKKTLKEAVKLLKNTVKIYPYEPEECKNGSYKKKGEWIIRPCKDCKYILDIKKFLENYNDNK